MRLVCVYAAPLAAALAAAARRSRSTIARTPSARAGARSRSSGDGATLAGHRRSRRLRHLRPTHPLSGRPADRSARPGIGGSFSRESPGARHCPPSSVPDATPIGVRRTIEPLSRPAVAPAPAAGASAISARRSDRARQRRHGAVPGARPDAADHRSCRCSSPLASARSTRFRPATARRSWPRTSSARAATRARPLAWG